MGLVVGETEGLVVGETVGLVVGETEGLVGETVGDIFETLLVKLLDWW